MKPVLIHHADNRGKGFSSGSFAQVFGFRMAVGIKGGI